MKYASELTVTEFLPTGTFLDKLSGIGGLPVGRITEIFGDAGIGKSTLALQCVASAQKQGVKCLWADCEWAFDGRYAESLGVYLSKLGVVQEQFAENTLDVLIEEIESGKWGMVVIDSIGGLTPRAEIEKGSDGKVIGAQANLVARFCRKVVPLLAMHKVALIVINHSFIDLMSGKIQTSGGKKLDYHKSISIRLKLNSKVVLKSGDTKVGKVVIGEVKKNKLAANEGTEEQSHLVFGEGFSQKADKFEEMLKSGEISKKGNTFFLGEVKLGVGKLQAQKALQNV